MKKYISVFIITALLMTAFAGFGGTALAEGDNKAIINLSPDTISAIAGDRASIIATITNNTEDVFTDCRIKVSGVANFHDGPLEPHGIREVPIGFDISEGMLGTDVKFTVEYKIGSSNWIEGNSTSLRINSKDQTAAIACTVKASRTLAAPGDQITFTFNIDNKGYVDLTNIQIWSDSVKKGSPLNTSPWTISANRSYNGWSYNYAFTAPKTVSFYITYNAGEMSGLKYDVPQTFELKEEERKVKATLSVNNSKPQAGEEVTFTLKITNEGNVDYTNLSVTWDGEDIGSPSRSLAQGAILEKQYKRTFETSADVQFTITMRDHAGQTRTVSTNVIRILLPIDAGALQGGLKLVIEPDRNEFTSAGVVNFSGYISNDSEYTLNSVTVTEDSLGDVYTISEMAADAKLPISYSADINETTSYTFKLSVKDRNEQEYIVSAEPITVTIQSAEEATADPAGDAPVVTLPPDGGAPDTLGIWFIILAALVILIIGVSAGLIVLWKKGRTPSRSSRSMAPKAKRPVRGGYNKSIKSRSYRDRNNF